MSCGCPPGGLPGDPVGSPLAPPRIPWGVPGGVPRRGLPSGFRKTPLMKYSITGILTPQEPLPPCGLVDGKYCADRILGRRSARVWTGPHTPLGQTPLWSKAPSCTAEICCPPQASRLGLSRACYVLHLCVYATGLSCGCPPGGPPGVPLGSPPGGSLGGPLGDTPVVMPGFLAFGRVPRS